MKMPIVSLLKDRDGLIDALRGMSATVIATYVATFRPRARPGAGLNLVGPNRGDVIEPSSPMTTIPIK
jgi:hypothetical protein